MLFGKIRSRLGPARLREMFTLTEAGSIASIIVLASGGFLAVALAQWKAAAGMAAAAMAIAAFLALFSARRSRLAAERMVGRVDAQGRQLLAKLQERKVIPVSAGWNEGPGRRDTARTATGQVISADELDTYTQLADTMPDHRWLDNTILRNASVLGRDLLAWRASGGRYRYSQVERILEQVRDPIRRADALNLLEPLDTEWMLRLARVVALQALQGNDRINALSLYRYVYEDRGPKLIAPSHTHGRLFHAVAYDLGEFKLAEEIIRKVRCPKSELHFMRADLLNPFTASPFANREDWLKAINENFLPDGLEPLELRWDDISHEPFDRIRAYPTTQVTEGPLVTVVVSAWRPDHGLRTAVESLLMQSWRPLEVLVVDDASPETYWPTLDAVEALDPRVRVIRQQNNGGTYVARNTALQEANGEFITFLDSDDWNHPRRIEHQVRALIEDASLICTTSRALRTSPDLVFNFPGVLAQRENASSLMFRLDAVRTRIGFFDSVRKGADTEYLLRIRQAFGAGSHRIIEQNLSMIRLTRGSLSRGEFKPGWRHPSRACYRRSYERWHRGAGAQPDTLRLGPVIAERTFSAPCRFLVDQDGEEVRRRSAFDVAFAADFRHPTVGVRGILDEARACKKSGLRVGLIHIESFRHFARIEMEVFWEPLHKAICSGEFEEILLTDAATVGTILVRDPATMQFPSLQRCGLKVDRVLLVAEKPPRDDNHDLWYEPSACLRNAQEIFGTWVTWVAQSVRARRALGMLLPPSSVAGKALPMVVDPTPWVVPPRRLTTRRPVLGRISGNSPRSLPSGPVSLLRAYPSDPRYDIRFMGGRAQCEDLLGFRAVPDNWTFHDPAVVSHSAFLGACDFFVYFDRGGGKPHVPRAMLEAMAAGCVVIAGKKFADILGDAAILCEPGDVSAVVDQFVSAPESFERQSAKARDYIELAYRPGQYVTDLQSLGN